MFGGRKLLIATKHGKERVIAPVLETALGVVCEVPKDFDTDLFGTFSGERERRHDAIATAKAKCETALKLYGGDLAVASEGSFGPHPELMFISLDEEIIYLLDTRNNLTIAARELSSETNFQGSEIRTLSDLVDFAERAGFPSHGLILRSSAESTLTKGIVTWEDLEAHANILLSKFDTIYVETDMRALYNPLRMCVIEKATRQLVNRINSRCPMCHFPDFYVTHVIAGLPCGLCKAATRSALKSIISCKNCSYFKEEFFPSGKSFEDPQYCDHCNP